MFRGVTSINFKLVLDSRSLASALTFTALLLVLFKTNYPSSVALSVLNVFKHPAATC